MRTPLLLACLLPMAARADFTAGEVNVDALPEVSPGFEVRVFAKEPLVRNPCAMAFDARGRLCVGMGPQYRNPKPDTPPDEVVILEDTDGDGTADARKVFATGLNCIQGLAWHGRDLWVANAPDLTIARDLDGDDVADEYVRVFTDLGNIEHGLHGLSWGPDGKLYMSKGNSKGTNTPERYAPKPFRDLWSLPAPTGASDAPVPVVFKKGDYRAAYHNPADDWGRTGGVLRCDDGGRNLEIVARGLRNPWDIAFDSGFNWLGTDNDQNEGDRNFMPFFGAHFGWGHGWSAHWTGANHPPTVPITGPVYHGSGTGVTFYDAPQFPRPFRRVFFWNDWLRKTTFVYRPRWDGALLAHDGEWEKFASAGEANALFRPVDIETGPDGALWITGWSRGYGVEWAPDGTQVNEGRVFRIAWKGAPLLRWDAAKRSRAMSEWTTEELADDLGSHLPVWRVNAQEELVRRGDAAKAVLLAQLKRLELSESAETWTLWTLGRMTGDESLDRFFAEVAERGALNRRVQALRILAHRARESARPLPTIVLTSLRDSEPRIRFEAVQAIWQARKTQAAPALADLAASETDRATFYAAWGALRGLAGTEALRAFLKDERPGVRRAALLALADLGRLTEGDAQLLVAHPVTADVAALWLAKRRGNPLVLIEPDGGEFADSIEVRLSPGMKPAQIRYTLDGSIPTAKSPAFQKPLTLRETTTLKAALFVKGEPVGQPAEVVFRKRTADSTSALPPMTLTPPAQPTTVAQVLAALSAGDASRGRTLFFAPGGAGCSACHRVGMDGRDFGPDLSNLGERGDPEALVRSILEPSAVITEGFFLQTVTLRDGAAHCGVLREETDRHLALALAGGEVVRIEKANIASREQSPLSAMPPFGPLLTPAHVADLVAFLGTRKPAAGGFAVEAKAERFVITHGAQRVADYVFADAAVLRPHFQNVHAPGGVQVTRTHPPVPGQDAEDHATMHPGVWLGFGDINGEDFWRNKGRIAHVRFAEPPTVHDGVLQFTDEGQFLTAAGQPLATLTSRLRVAHRTVAFVLTWDAEVRATERDLVFGDQEEMGLGARVATALTEKAGGVITSSDGTRGAKATWGRQATWCDYSGLLDDVHAGISIVPDARNPRPCWWHNRDYGVFVANPFGKRAGLANGKLRVPKGEALHLRFHVILHASSNAPDLPSLVRDLENQ